MKSRLQYVVDCSASATSAQETSKDRELVLGSDALSRCNFLSAMTNVPSPGCQG